MDELIERLGVWIDRSGATAVLREVGGGCHPATRSELALWDALEAALVDAERYRWALNNSCWIRGEHAAYVAIPVAPDADLSCVAMRDAAIDRERGKGGKEDGND